MDRRGRLRWRHQHRPLAESAQYAKYRQPGNIKVPFFLQPEKHYVGAAWYQRDVDIPAAWQGKRVVLSLERPHWETRVWLDGTGDRHEHEPLHAALLRPRHRPGPGQAHADASGWITA